MTTRTLKTPEIQNVTSISRVTWPDETSEPSKLFLVDGHARVYVAQHRVVVLRREADVTASRREGRDLVVTTVEGEEWRFRSSGCGCGSPLKGFRPT